MKKLLTALVLTLSTAALAQSDVDSKAQQENQRNDTTRMKTGIDSTEVLPSLSGAKSEAKQADINLMNKAHAFNVNGTVAKASNGELTLSRQNEKLPDVKLDVRDQTQVMLDGKKVAANDIPEGAQVRARFQLDGDDAVALDVNATSPKGVAGAKKGAKKETKETKETKGTMAPAPAPAPDTQQGTTGTQPGTTGTQPTPHQ